jgi:hypothetical protein
LGLTAGSNGELPEGFMPKEKPALIVTLSRRVFSFEESLISNQVTIQVSAVHFIVADNHVKQLFRLNYLRSLPADVVEQALL